MEEEFKEITDKEYDRIINLRSDYNGTFNILVIPYNYCDRNTDGAKDGINEAQDISIRLDKDNPSKKKLLNMYINGPKVDNSEEHIDNSNMRNNVSKKSKNKNKSKQGKRKFKERKNDIQLNNDNSEKRHFRVLFLDEFKKLKDKLNDSSYQSPFNEEDTLYITGHANINLIVQYSPKALAKHLSECLTVTGIKNIKLLGCHTGSRIIEDLSQDNNLDDEMKEKLTNSYAKKLSEELCNKGLYGIKVYGYMGALTNETEVINHNVSGSKTDQRTEHKMRSFVKPINEDGSDDVENKVRASKGRVCFIDGVLDGETPEMQNSHIGPLGNNNPRRYYRTGP